MARKSNAKTKHKAIVNWKNVFKSGFMYLMSYLWLAIRTVKRLKEARIFRFFSSSSNYPSVDEEGNIIHKRTVLARVFYFFRKQKPENSLSQWVEDHLGNMGIHITNFDSDWCDGLALCALIECISPGACPKYDLLNPTNKLNNCRLALKLTQKYFNIPNNIITADEMMNETNGKKMREFLKRLRLAVTSHQNGGAVTNDSNQTVAKRCFAKGRGLQAGLIGKISKFNITFPTNDNLHICVDISGPRNCQHLEDITNLDHKFENKRCLKQNSSDNEDIATEENDLAVRIQFEYHKVREDQIEVNYIPKIPGKYTINIQWKGNKIFHSPFSVIVAETIEQLNEETKGKCCRRIVENNNYRKPILERMPSCLQLCTDNAAAVLRRTSTVHRSYSNNLFAIEPKRQGTIKRRTVLKKIITKTGQEIIIQDGCSTPSISSQSSTEDIKDSALFEKAKITNKDQEYPSNAIKLLATEIVESALQSATASVKSRYRVEALEFKRRKFFAKCESLKSQVFKKPVLLGEGRRVQSSNALLTPNCSKQYQVSPFSDTVEKPKPFDETPDEIPGVVFPTPTFDPLQNVSSKSDESNESCHATQHSENLVTVHTQCTENISSRVKNVSTKFESTVNTHRKVTKTVSDPPTKTHLYRPLEQRPSIEKDYSSDTQACEPVRRMRGNILRQSLSLPSFMHSWKAFEYDPDDAEVMDYFSTDTDTNEEFTSKEGDENSNANTETGKRLIFPDSASDYDSCSSRNIVPRQSISPISAYLENYSSFSDRTFSPISAFSSPKTSPRTSPRTVTRLQLNPETVCDEKQKLHIIPNHINNNGGSYGRGASAFKFLSPPVIVKDAKKVLRCNKTTQVGYAEIKRETGWVSSSSMMLHCRVPVYQTQEPNSQQYIANKILNAPSTKITDRIESSSLEDINRTPSISFEMSESPKAKARSSLKASLTKNHRVVSRRPYKGKIKLDPRLIATNSEIEKDDAKVLNKCLRMWKSASKFTKRDSDSLHAARQKFKRASLRTKTISRRVKFANKIIVYYRSSSRKSTSSSKGSQTSKESQSFSFQETNKFPSKTKQTDNTENSNDKEDILYSKSKLRTQTVSSMSAETNHSTSSHISDRSINDIALDKNTDQHNSGDCTGAHHIENFGISDEPRDNLLQELSSFRRLSLPVIRKPSLKQVSDAWHFKTIDDSKSFSLIQEQSISIEKDDHKQNIAKIAPARDKRETTHSEFDFKEDKNVVANDASPSNTVGSSFQDQIEEAENQLKIMNLVGAMENGYNQDPSQFDQQGSTEEMLDEFENMIKRNQTVSLHNEKPDASKCYAFGAGLHFGQVNSKNNFQVRTKGGGNGCLTVSITGPKPHTVKETNVMYTGDDLYEIIFEVTDPGFYVICIKWSDTGIMDSPYICKVTF